MRRARCIVLELAGTFVFALSGAAAGVRYRLDLFGVLALSCATATAGGITRDVLIGAVPPAALRDWRYLGISVLAGLLVFFSSPRPERQQRLRNLVLTFDAAGLALFAVSGTQKALGYGLNPVMAALLGMLTGIGGGILRDVLVSDIPAVLHSDLYAVAALAGAIVVVAGPHPECSGLRRRRWPERQCASESASSRCGAAGGFPPPVRGRRREAPTVRAAVVIRRRCRSGVIASPLPREGRGSRPESAEPRRTVWRQAWVGAPVQHLGRGDTPPQRAQGHAAVRDHRVEAVEPGTPPTTGWRSRGIGRTPTRTASTRVPASAGR